MSDKQILITDITNICWVPFWVITGQQIQLHHLGAELIDNTTHPTRIKLEIDMQLIEEALEVWAD
jgi:hypothetical protein